MNPLHRFARTLTLPLGLSLALAACGGSSATNSDGGTDGGDMGRVIEQPDLGPEEFSDGGGGATTAVLTTADFTGTGGTLGTVALSGHAQKTLDSSTIDNDSIVRAFNGKVYVLDRTHGTLRIYDPAKQFADPVEIATGDPADDAAAPHADSNPSDLIPVPASSKLYVVLTSNDAAHAIGVIDSDHPEAGVTKWIALPVAGSPIPRVSRLWPCGDYAYAFAADIDASNTVTGPGRVIAIDYATDAVSTDADAVITLAGKNPGGGFPYGVAAPYGGCDDILVADTGDAFGATPDSGGIERVDLTARVSRGMVISGDVLGGNPGSIASTSPDLAFVTVGALEGKVVAFDPAQKKVVGDVLGPAQWIPFVQLGPDGQLYVGVNISTGGDQVPAGFYIGAADGQPLSATPTVELPQPPYSIAFF